MNNIKEYPKLSNQDLETNLITVEQKISDLGGNVYFSREERDEEVMQLAGEYSHYYRLLYYILEERLKRKK